MDRNDSFDATRRFAPYFITKANGDFSYFAQGDSAMAREARCGVTSASPRGLNIPSSRLRSGSSNGSLSPNALRTLIRANPIIQNKQRTDFETPTHFLRVGFFRMREFFMSSLAQHHSLFELTGNS